MGTVLIAASEDEQKFLKTALGKDHAYVWCTTWRQVEHEMDTEIDAVLCGVHFDDGRLFDLVEWVKSGSGTRNTPVYGVVVHARHFSEHFLTGLRSAVSLFDAEGVLDLAGLRRDCGDAEAIDMLRTAVDGIVVAGLRKRRRHLRQVPTTVAV